ncbi:hypothetical protein EVA_11038 [gut metagenome]|uniref:Uncharacterized protein n=1 Tax=gut metagenome TaxID=749906 RepID=J9G1X4_9ZZZZ
MSAIAPYPYSWKRSSTSNMMAREHTAQCQTKSTDSSGW